MTTTVTERKLAVWQTEPCPTWCNIDHSDRDFDEDRQHMGPTIDLPMRLAPAVEMAGGRWEIATWKVYLRQPHDGGPVRVHMYNDDKALMQVDLCPDEAQVLAQVLQLLLGQIAAQT